MESHAISAQRLMFASLRWAALFLVFFLGFNFNLDSRFYITPNTAHATCANCVCVSSQHASTRTRVTTQHGIGTFLTDPESLAYSVGNVCIGGTGTRGYIGRQMCRHRERFIVFYWFKQHILAAMMMMTEQLVASAMNQMMIVGAFFDADIQLRTQRLFQELSTQAHKDYHPSFGMCEIGTLSRSLAASQRHGEYNAYFVSQHMQDRQMRNWTQASAAGKGLDIVHRWEQFRTFFCNPHGNDEQLGPRTSNPICLNPAALQPSYRDMDVDYSMMIDHPHTLPVDYSDNTLSSGEQRILGLASNLYGNDVFSYFPEAFFKNPDNHDEYTYIRSLVAKRSVAQNSFDAIVGMKSQGKIETETDLRPYMEKVLEQFNFKDPGQQIAYLGARPSYYAQMEFLTKKLYQRPEFYTDLYDKPANVARKKAAMQALGLAQNMDLFKSKLRAEAALAVLTEIEIQKAQDKLQIRMDNIRGTGLQ